MYRGEHNVYPLNAEVVANKVKELESDEPEDSDSDWDYS
jgi:hypothetical protein